MSELNIITGHEAASILNIKSPSHARRLLDKRGVISFLQKNVKCYDRNSFDEKFPEYKGIEVDPATLEMIRSNNREQKDRYNAKKKGVPNIVKEIRSKDHVVYQSINRIHDLIGNGEFDKVRNIIDYIEKYKESLKLSQQLESEIYKIIS